DRQQIRGERGDRGVDHVVVEDLVVDLVGQDHQAVLAGDLDDVLQHVLGVDGPGGVVGVDHHDRLGALGDPVGDVGDVGPPVLVLVAAVVDGAPAGEGDRGGPQRVVGLRDQHLVAVV